ncbi:MAG: hypothetical protein LUF30_06285 [Lachnospiraceae bacterium]|nr:hypothetical protein [Lachnospiraceae bacterium]
MNGDASMRALEEKPCGQSALQYVIFILPLQWKDEAAMLKERLETEGIVCMDLSVERNTLRLDGADKLGVLSELLDESFIGVGDWKKETVFLTDSSEIGRTLAQLRLVYFGCTAKAYEQSMERNASHLDGADTWFEGAVLVLEGFADIDARYLEEWLLRAQGLPALIAQTEHLLIREIAEEDIPELVRISRQDGQTALAAERVEMEEEEKSETPSRCAWDVFSEDRLRAYIQSAYRLQGYGLWSVLYQGKVIGCCGFAPWDGAVEMPPRFARGQNAPSMERNASRLDGSVEMLSRCAAGDIPSEGRGCPHPTIEDWGHSPARNILYEVWDAHDLEERNGCANLETPSRFAQWQDAPSMEKKCYAFGRR